MALDRRSAIMVALFLPLSLGLLNGLWIESLYEIHPIWYWVADILQYVFVPALSLLFLLRFGQVQPNEFGFRPFAYAGGGVDLIGQIVVISVVFWLAYDPVKDIAYRYLWQYAAPFGHGSAIPESGVLRIIVILYFSATAALVEEPVFRALPWLYLSQFGLGTRALWWYVPVTASLFSAIHYEQGPHALIATFVLGVVLAFLYPRVRNIWPFIAGHFITDVILFSGG